MRRLGGWVSPRRIRSGAAWGDLAGRSQGNGGDQRRRVLAIGHGRENLAIASAGSYRKVASASRAFWRIVGIRSSAIKFRRPDPRSHLNFIEEGWTHYAPDAREADATFLYEPALAIARFSRPCRNRNTSVFAGPPSFLRIVRQITHAAARSDSPRRYPTAQSAQHKSMLGFNPAETSAR